MSIVSTTTSKRAATALVTAALAAAGLVAGVAPASAASAAPAAPAVSTTAAAACTATAGLPARVSIDRAVQQVPVSLRTTCTADFADAYLVGPREQIYDVAEWEAPLDRAVYRWDVYGDITVPGTYRTAEIELYDAPAGLTTKDARTVAKFGSKAGLTGTRAGTQVRLTACASYYNGRRDAFVPWSAHKATIQKLGADGRTWDFVRTVGTNSSGCATYTLTAAAAATYRVTTYETYQIFSRTSPSVRV